MSVPRGAARRRITRRRREPVTEAPGRSHRRLRRRRARCSPAPRRPGAPGPGAARPDRRPAGRVLAVDRSGRAGAARARRAGGWSGRAAELAAAARSSSGCRRRAVLRRPRRRALTVTSRLSTRWAGPARDRRRPRRPRRGVARPGVGSSSGTRGTPLARCPARRPTSSGPAGCARPGRPAPSTFPRTDPAVIMLVTTAGTASCWAARRAGRPGGSRSWPASSSRGSRPRPAVAREVAEEVGLAVTDVRYVASQPWPFP